MAEQPVDGIAQVKIRHAVMSLVVGLFGLFIAALGAIGIVRPALLIDFARIWQTSAGIYIAAVIRLIMGAVLYLAAPDSRLPTTLRILGIVIFVAGVATPFFGRERFHRMLEWWVNRSRLLQRAWAACALAFGLLLIYAVIP